MRGFSQLAARVAALLVLVATSAWAQQEELWLDSRSAAPVSSQMVLKKGRPYLVTMQGTYTVWGGNINAGARSLQPEAAPMFPSPKGGTRNVGADPEFIFAWSKGHALEKNPEPAPLRNTSIQLSLDGGKSWKHPATPASFNAKEHKYAYELMGDDNALQVRINDKPVADNSGRLQIFVVPAEELWLDSQSAAPVSSQMVLEKGKPYRVTMQGTYTVWGGNIDAGARSLPPEAAPMFPSPAGAARNVGADPEFIFAWSKGHALEKNPEPAPLRNTSSIQVSLDGGKSWKHPATPDSFNAKEHKYTYELMGDGSALQVRINDNPVSDNFGRLQIFLLPGA